MATCLASTTASRLKFKVRRQPAVLVAPAAPTPRELKRLSDIDDQEGLRFHAPSGGARGMPLYAKAYPRFGRPPLRRRLAAACRHHPQGPDPHFHVFGIPSRTTLAPPLHAPGILLYRQNASCDGLDPAAVIRDAVARALVHYYPLAGRLRELQGRKLAVDCTAQGVLMAEADTDVRLEDFGDSVHPPLPCLDELFLDFPAATSSIVDSPLVHIQVTRLACGGFILAVQMSHTVADAQGILQFLKAVAELARGAAAPMVRPVWARDLLLARNPPRPSFAHREYEEMPLDPKDDVIALPADELVQGFVFFRPKDVTAIKARLAPGLRKRSTTFDVLVAFLWKCRTMALQLPDADEEVRLGFAVSACHGRRGLHLPKGYYGNTIALAVAIATAGELCANPVGYAVELVQKAKAEVDAEYIQSVADLLVLRGRPLFTTARLYLVSDVTKLGFAGLDYGWGQPVYGGVATMGPGPSPLAGMSSFLIPCEKAKGENGIIVPMCLPGRAMDRFMEEVPKLMMRLSSL